MRYSFALLLISATTYISAFTPPTFATTKKMIVVHPSTSRQWMSAETEESTVPIVVTGNNIEVTPALMDYVNKKMEGVIGKLAGSDAVGCDVHLSVNKNPKVKIGHRAAVTTSLDGTVIRTTEDSEDMYASIDLVADRLARKLRKYKERRLEGYHGGPNMGKNLADVLDSLPEEAAAEEAVDSEFIDPEAPVITKIKSFDLSSTMTVNEAIFALDYIDHDFYVFRDAETKDISVVYKRNAGGVGLIQPQQ